MSPISTLSYQGTPVRLRGTMLNLTDMWRAAGCPEYRRPAKWLFLEETMRFRAHAQAHWTELEEPASDNVLHGDIIRLDPDGFVATLRGRHGGTWAHWQLALSYAGADLVPLRRAVRPGQLQHDPPPHRVPAPQPPAADIAPPVPSRTSGRPSFRLARRAGSPGAAKHPLVP